MSYGTGVGLGPGNVVLDGDPLPPKKGHSTLLVEGMMGPHLAQCGRGRACLRAKFHLDPSSRLPTIHQRHRQIEKTDRQRSDSIGRTVL